jgi:hypothetical protein
MFGAGRGLRLSAAVLSTTLAAAASVALAGPAAAAVPGHQIVTVDSADDSQDKAFTAVCPAGKRVIGTAASVVDGGGEVAVDAVVPGATTVTAVAYEDGDGFAGDWQVRVTAVCATAPAGLEIVFEDSGPATGPLMTEIVSCPGTKQPLGSGYEVMGGFGEVRVSDAYAWTASSVIAIAEEDQDGTANQWNLRTWAICANPLTGYDQISVDSANDSVSPKNAPATCPVGKVATGAGFSSRNGLGQVSADTRLAGRTATAYGREDQDGLATNWEVGVTVVCATA